MKLHITIHNPNSPQRTDNKDRCSVKIIFWDILLTIFHSVVIVGANYYYNVMISLIKFFPNRLILYQQ